MNYTNFVRIQSIDIYYCLIWELSKVNFLLYLLFFPNLVCYTKFINMPRHKKIFKRKIYSKLARHSRNE